MAEIENNTHAVVAENEPTAPAGITTIAVEEPTTPLTTVQATTDLPATTEQPAKPVPAEDPIGWLTPLGRNAVNKVSYEVLNWVNNTAVDEDKRQPTPGAKKQSTSPMKFLGFLQDGSVLANLANKLQPGAIETVHEGEAAKEKANQTANLENFINFLKNNVGLSDNEVFNPADVQEKRKGGFGAVLSTLIKLAGKAQEQFARGGLDVDYLLQIGKQAVQSNFIQTIINFFKKRPANGHQEKKEQDETIPTPAVNGNENALKEEVNDNKPASAVVDGAGVAVAVQ
uniref:Calponin-homology (CH) domain-containing protein n=1 Tax=Plectus sambesii TaxID=2011161 RepID=A0A914XL80_9BILA